MGTNGNHWNMLVYLSILFVLYGGAWMSLFGVLIVIMCFNSSYVGYPSIYGLFIIAAFSLPFDYRIYRSELLRV